MCVCPDYAGPTAWVNTAAVTAQVNAVAYMNSLWRIYYSFARSNSGGGALMCWAFGNNMLPRQQGMYLASSVYDVMESFTQGPTVVGTRLQLQHLRRPGYERRHAAAVGLGRRPHPRLLQPG